jgi:myosin-5
MSTESFAANQAVEVYTKGVRAWFPDDEEGWVSASLKSNKTKGGKVRLVFEDDNTGEVICSFWNT